MPQTSPIPKNEDESVTGLVFNIMRFAINDGPGIRTTVFLKGCPLSCKWCHNPESQAYARELIYSADKCVQCQDCCSACGSGALHWEGAPLRDRSRCTLCEKCIEACPADARRLIGKPISVTELMDVINRDRVFYEQSGGGVTFSGGEPMCQPDFLEAALIACRDGGLPTVVDTSGYVSAKVLRRIAARTDEFLFDLKLMDDDRHRSFVGVSNEIILTNLSILAREHPNVNVRIPIIPGVNDDEENLDASFRFLAELGIKKTNLLPYHESGVAKYKRLGLDYEMPALKTPPAERLQAIVSRYSSSALTVSIGG